MEKQRIIFWLIAWCAHLSSFHVRVTHGLVYEVTFIPSNEESTPSAAVSTTNATIETNTNGDGQLAPVLVAAIVGGCMVLLMILAVLAVCIFYRVRECKDERDLDDDESNPNLLDVQRTGSISRSGKESLNSPSFVTESTLINDRASHMYDVPDVSLDLDKNELGNGPIVTVSEYVDTVCPNVDEAVKLDDQKDNLSSFSLGGISLTSDELDIDLYSSNGTVELTGLPRSKVYTGVDNVGFVDDDVHYAVADTKRNLGDSDNEILNGGVSKSVENGRVTDSEVQYVTADTKQYVEDPTNEMSNDSMVKGVANSAVNNHEILYAVADMKHLVEDPSHEISNEGVPIGVHNSRVTAGEIHYDTADTKLYEESPAYGLSNDRMIIGADDNVVKDHEIPYAVADTKERVDDPSDGMSNDRMSISTQECLDDFDRILSNHSEYDTNDMLGIDLSNKISKQVVENIYIPMPVNLDQIKDSIPEKHGNKSNYGDNAIHASQHDKSHLFDQTDSTKSTALQATSEQMKTNDHNKPNEVNNDTDANTDYESIPKPLPRRKHSFKMNVQVPDNIPNNDNATTGDTETNLNVKSDIV
ncbi:unnamed protein product [Owenia fusiformis]|uniref:Uncharacterized protein n=1 Tax=Owenia fusiformis TaxID=6347 RepID=A0A8J1TR64_OWEFU|nr:unnamed protein product [Owenia fusiformis]